MPERVHMSHEEYVQQSGGTARDIARKAMNGEISLLLAVREINSALHGLPELERKVQRSDFLFFKGVSSECDELPLGTERQYWAPESLREKDLRARSYEQKIRKDILSALARIADDLSK
jgi:hypothetical protein